MPTVPEMLDDRALADRRDNIADCIKGVACGVAGGIALTPIAFCVASVVTKMISAAAIAAVQADQFIGGGAW